MSNNTDITERIGVNKCESEFLKLGFIFREQRVGDYGIDAIVEPKKQDYLSGKLIAVQIKSGDSYFKEIDNDCVVFRGDIKHYNYWINHSLPVIIVLYSPNTDKCIWEVVNKQTAQVCKSGWKILIPCTQTIESSKEALQNLAEKQSEHEMRWNSLVIAKEWMEEARERGELILEVEEWINKCSGKGSFILKSVEDDGQENTIFGRTFWGFGTKKYELVIQELFPWADINIDEEFYDENMEEDLYYRRDTTERELAARWGIKGAELEKYSDRPPKIYPYRNGAGEVDFYRLKLSLNQVGKAFLEMENFLETGKCYFLDKMMI